MPMHSWCGGSRGCFKAGVSQMRCAEPGDLPGCGSPPPLKVHPLPVFVAMVAFTAWAVFMAFPSPFIPQPLGNSALSAAGLEVSSIIYLTKQLSFVQQPGMQKAGPVPWQLDNSPPVSTSLPPCPCPHQGTSQLRDQVTCRFFPLPQKVLAALTPLTARKSDSDLIWVILTWLISKELRLWSVHSKSTLLTYSEKNRHKAWTVSGFWSKLMVLLTV